MSLGKILGIITVFLLIAIGIAVFLKESEASPRPDEAKGPYASLIEVDLDQEAPVAPAPPPAREVVADAQPAVVVTEDLPDANRISELFNVKGPKLSIVETVTYKSRVPWQKGRPAWLSDYASYYDTSRHFIARSLNGKPDYFKQDVSEGDRFNVYRKDRQVSFQLVIDTSRCKLWLYCIDQMTQEKILLKQYPISIGRPDSSKASGLLTPLGKYSLGNRVAVYKPSVMGHHKGQKTEMIRIFGTRWIPFDKEISGCTAPAKGFGIHGVPWVKKANGEWEQDASSLGKYESDGCIRMSSKDIEEVFAIVITKPATVEMVKDFSQSEMSVK